MDTKLTKHSPTLKFEFNPNKADGCPSDQCPFADQFWHAIGTSDGTIDLKVQIRERAIESALVFVDFDQWENSLLEHHGVYKVLLYPKSGNKVRTNDQSMTQPWANTDQKKHDNKYNGEIVFTMTKFKAFSEGRGPKDNYSDEVIIGGMPWKIWIRNNKDKIAFYACCFGNLKGSDGPEKELYDKKNDTMTFKTEIVAQKPYRIRTGKIVIDDIENAVENFEQLISFINSPRAELDDDCVENVLALANRYLLESVENRCVDFLMTKSKKLAIFKFRLAHKYGIIGMKRKILSQMTKNEFAIAGENIFTVFLEEHDKLDPEAVEELKKRHDEILGTD
ncbi:hypothetical protein niasHT_036952 [Heterodera trifolii]|uniref:BTB domain-containing protein n=1 Tax=Heterodera trifolii TaxID=157864 RepID=A0ABD2ID49_9BILA